MSSIKDNTVLRAEGPTHHSTIFQPSCPPKTGGGQRKGEKINGGGPAKAVEVVGKIGFEDTKSSMEQRLAKLRLGTPDSGDPGGLAVVGDLGETPSWEILWEINWSFPL